MRNDNSPFDKWQNFCQSFFEKKKKFYFFFLVSFGFHSCFNRESVEMLWILRQESVENLRRVRAYDRRRFQVRRCERVGETPSRIRRESMANQRRNETEYFPLHFRCRLWFERFQPVSNDRPTFAGGVVNQRFDALQNRQFSGLVCVEDRFNRRRNIEHKPVVFC